MGFLLHREPGHTRDTRGHTGTHHGSHRHTGTLIHSRSHMKSVNLAVNRQVIADNPHSPYSVSKDGSAAPGQQVKSRLKRQIARAHKQRARWGTYMYDRTERADTIGVQAYDRPGYDGYVDTCDSFRRAFARLVHRTAEKGFPIQTCLSRYGPQKRNTCALRRSKTRVEDRKSNSKRRGRETTARTDPASTSTNL